MCSKCFFTTHSSAFESECALDGSAAAVRGRSTGPSTSWSAATVAICRRNLGKDVAVVGRRNRGFASARAAFDSAPTVFLQQARHIDMIALYMVGSSGAKICRRSRAVRIKMSRATKIFLSLPSGKSRPCKKGCPDVPQECTVPIPEAPWPPLAGPHFSATGIRVAHHAVRPAPITDAVQSRVTTAKLGPSHLNSCQHPASLTSPPRLSAMVFF